MRYAIILCYNIKNFEDYGFVFANRVCAAAAVAQPMRLVWGWNYLFDQPMANGGICGETCLNKVIFGAGSAEIKHFTYTFYCRHQQVPYHYHI